jgi:stage II sporulation protein D
MLACSTRAPSRVIVEPPRGDPISAGGTLVRVGLVGSEPQAGATTDFTWYDQTGRVSIARGRQSEYWRLERRGATVRAVAPGGATSWQRGLILRASGNGFVAVSGRRYRGELQILPVNEEIVVINRVPLEDYLRGVVAVEMGSRPRGDSAAVQAQAVASRSFVLTRIGNAQRAYDVLSSVADQAYGGLDAENASANAAVEATRGLVLKYNGRVADALYSSTCGGGTAEADEIWRTSGAPYLRRVSDQIANSERHYCDIAPRFRWNRELSGTELNEALTRYLAEYTAGVPPGGPGAARAVRVASTTGSGRVGVLEITTARGTFPVRGNDIRYVLRAPGGEMLNSTYFSVETLHDNGGVSRVTLRGRGFGHGVGMCQWGAIGRARAGQSFRAILGTYYPGTSIGPIQ